MQIISTTTATRALAEGQYDETNRLVVMQALLVVIGLRDALEAALVARLLFVGTFEQEGRGGHQHQPACTP